VCDFFHGFYRKTSANTKHALYLGAFLISLVVGILFFFAELLGGKVLILRVMILLSMVWCLREELKGTGVKAATINPCSVDTPWFDGKDVDRFKMLSLTDVASAVCLIID